MKPLVAWLAGAAVAALVAPTLPAAAQLAAGQTRPAQQGARGPGVPEFLVRPGYRVTLAASGQLDDPRFMSFDDKGTLYLSQPKTGTVLAMTDKDGDGVYDARTVFLKDKPKVQATQFKDGWLWYAQSTAVGRARDTNGDGVADEVVELVKDLPGERGHWWRALLVTDDAIYTSVGDPGNITIVDEDKDELTRDREKIWKYNLDGSGKTLFASGVRNTEKLLIRPGTKEIWGVDHGSDNYGLPIGEKPGQSQPLTNVVPPDEFNHYEQGKFYGHPFFAGNNSPRLEFLQRKDLVEWAAKNTPAEWRFGPHWAANGWTFLTKDYYPGHRGDAFVACRGSWNSTVKQGYRVERVMFDQWTGKPFGSQMVVGTLDPEGKREFARPVDCAEAPDGSVLFTCDVTKKIYRISRADTPRAADAR